MASKQPGRTLAEEQAYQQGRVDGRRDCLLALGGAFGKVLEPDSLSSLAKALLEGLRANPPLLEPSSEKVDPTDPTEPANWRHPQPGPEVYAVGGCIFRYCPHPERCKAHPDGCSTLEQTSAPGQGAKR